MRAFWYIVSFFSFFVTPTNGIGPLTPTAAQYNWQRSEIMALIHFNMATFFKNGDPGCDASNWPEAHDTAAFAPTSLNVSQWIDSMDELGITEAVLTAKHGCGFYIWPTNVTLPDGRPYGYNVNSSLNVLKEFTDAMNKRGKGHGFYYSLTNNFYLNLFSFKVRDPSTLIPYQVNITQEQWEVLALESLKELWTSFGNLTEIWLDSGSPLEMKTNLTDLFNTLQPQALALNGEGISRSPGRWSGTEGDVPPGWPNIWSTTCCDVNASDPAHTCEGPGCSPTDPRGTAFYASSSTDYTLQADDVWFFEPNYPLRPITELISTYHATVGANTVLELDFAISRTGQLHQSHVDLYKAFGQWIRNCYGSPLAQAQLNPGEYTITVPLLPSGQIMDRIVLQEALAVDTYGQCVTNYTLEVMISGSSTWSTFGKSGAYLIGRKRIELNSPTPGTTGPSLNVTYVRFNVTDWICEPAVNISIFSPENCSPPPPPPPPPPASMVKFVYSNGLCLVTNSSGVPCVGMPYTLCQVFLGDCGASSALWDDGNNGQVGHYLTSLANNQSYSNAINIDCNSCSDHAVAKLLPGTSSSANIVFSNGQLVYSCDGTPGLCLDSGDDGPPTPPCGGEAYMPKQVQVGLCSKPGTQGWTRQVVSM